jgi:PIN domain nuclease of toxin-antitoxin system
MVSNETAFGYSPVDMLFLDIPKVSAVEHNRINNPDNELFFRTADPFDRILIAQAALEGLVLLTADPVVARYPGPIRKV